MQSNLLWIVSTTLCSPASGFYNDEFSYPPCDNLPKHFIFLLLSSRGMIYIICSSKAGYKKNNPSDFLGAMMSSRTQIHLETFKCSWTTVYSLEAEGTQEYDTSLAKNGATVYKGLFQPLSFLLTGSYYSS